MTHWEVRIDHDPEADSPRYYITDSNLQILIRPTSLRILPVMISIIKHNYHGKKAQLWVDGHQAFDPETLTRAQGENLISQLLAGEKLFVEFYEWPFEQPQCIGVLLKGFAEAWIEARRNTPMIEFEEGVGEEEHQEPWSQTPDSLFLAFQATAVTATQRLRHMNEAHHAVSVLALTYLHSSVRSIFFLPLVRPTLAVVSGDSGVSTI